MPTGAPPPILPLRELLPDLRIEPGEVRPAAQSALAPGFPELPNLPETHQIAAPSPWNTFPGMPWTEGTSAGSPTAASPVRLRDGCHLISFHPLNPNRAHWPAAAGTLRWEQLDGQHVAASADLYRTDLPFGTRFELQAQGNPDPEGAGQPIPAFPRERYHAYLRIGAPGFRPAPTAPPNAPHANAFLDQGGTPFEGCIHRLASIEPNLWEPGEPVFLHLRSATSDPDRPDGLCDRARFDLIDASGTSLGELHARWISPYFRDAVVEIDTENALPAPTGNGADETWETVFGRVGWRIRVETGNLSTPTPASGRWTYAELHQAMLRSRATTDLDAEWRYHVSLVRSFADPDAPIGIAFDHEAMDLNGIPREGIAIYGGASLPREPLYGPYAGRVISACPDLCFHIAVHEMGHAMGLYHNHVGFGIMEQLDDLAEKAASGALSRSDLEPRFNADDIFRLRHLPDIHVRPGGTDFTSDGVVEDHNEAHESVGGLHLPRIRPDPTGSIGLRLRSPASEVPLGAPLRVDFELVNQGSAPVEVPNRISLATPYVRGWVIGPDGSENEFRSLFKTVQLGSVTPLAPHAVREGSLTLLRGNRGGLTARPGRHYLWLEVSWHHRGQFRCARQRMAFEVQPTHGSAESRIARRLLRTPETLAYLILGRGLAFAQGEHAICDALGSSVLAPHFAFIRARALADSGFDEATDWTEVSRLLAPPPHRSLLNRRERTKADHLRRTAESLSSTQRLDPVIP